MSSTGYFQSSGLFMCLGTEVMAVTAGGIISSTQTDCILFCNKNRLTADFELERKELGLVFMVLFLSFMSSSDNKV